MIMEERKQISERIIATCDLISRMSNIIIQKLEKNIDMEIENELKGISDVLSAVLQELDEAGLRSIYDSSSINRIDKCIEKILGLQTQIYALVC